MSELDPRRVAARLARLRSIYIAETVEQASMRLVRERPVESIPFEVGVARRLAELRALCELTRALHSAS
jgi:hypothetical protein